MANAACAARADASVLTFGGGRIDALVLCEGSVLRTSACDETHFGVAQVRRILRRPELELVHLVFAPLVDRPLLLSIVRLDNKTDRPLHLEYTETWDVSHGEYREREAAGERISGSGVRALADVSAVLRARPPQPAPRIGLALDIELALPPGARRHLYFAYVDDQPGTDPGELVRAWRGDVPHELERTLRRWRERSAPGSDPVSGYRACLGSLETSR